MIVESVDSLIKESERIYLGRQEAILLGQDFIRRHFWYPVLMVSKGFDFAKKESLIFSILYFVGIYFAALGMREVSEIYPKEVHSIISSALLYLAIFVPVFVILFLPPSTFSGSRIDLPLIKSLDKKIEKNDINRCIKLLDFYQERVDKRILFLKRLYALSWALFIYLVKELQNTTADNTTSTEINLMPLAFYGVAIFLGYLCIQSYAKSAETIMTSVRIALIEKKDPS